MTGGIASPHPCAACSTEYEPMIATFQQICSPASRDQGAVDWLGNAGVIKMKGAFAILDEPGPI
ncbi:MAG: hypothetical protein AAF967_10890 [Pseudomonadota bacterium]